MRSTTVVNGETVSVYDIGDGIDLTAYCTDKTGALTDPTTIVAKVEDPNGAKTTYTYGLDAMLIRDSQGIYRLASVYPTVAGYWYGRFETTGAVPGADEELFVVRPSKFF